MQVRETWQIKRGPFLITPLMMGYKNRIMCDCGGRTIKRNLVAKNGEDFDQFWDGNEHRKIQLVCVRCRKVVREKNGEEKQT